MKRFLPLAAVAMLLALVGPSFPAPSHAQGYTTQTVEVSEGGFNPDVCQMNREFIQFKNVGTTPRRVILPSLIGQPPIFDTGYLEPGQTSISFAMQFPGTFRFYDADNLSNWVSVRTPVFTPTWDVICTPDPSKTPPPPPCLGVPHCIRVPNVALDG
ncbi:MAG TPA: hypothetical protein PJ994_13575 [Tepidiformaceae bacterium]|nr:hypothetical protein [Tepidiformaceae bacterium]